MKDRDELSHYSCDPVSSRKEAADRRLAELLNLYEPPVATARLDRRVLESYRARQSHTGKTRLWRRMITASVRVPAPLAAAVLLTLIAAIAWAMKTATASPAQTLLKPFDSAPSLNIVEVPVIQERIVTRTVYVGARNGKKPETGDRSNTARQNGSSLALFSSGAENGYVIQQSSDLRGFQPVSELKIKVIRRNETDED